MYVKLVSYCSMYVQLFLFLTEAPTGVQLVESESESRMNRKRMEEISFGQATGQSSSDGDWPGASISCECAPAGKEVASGPSAQCDSEGNPRPTTPVLRRMGSRAQMPQIKRLGSKGKVTSITFNELQRIIVSPCLLDSGWSSNMPIFECY
eukprot:m.52096 g.52096  ORF g.52096 m.52096 type:complete len:151 (-) comp11283_c0_seq3:309-761(-)